MAKAVPKGGPTDFVTVMGIVGIVASILPQVAEANTPLQLDAAGGVSIVK